MGKTTNNLAKQLEQYAIQVCVKAAGLIRDELTETASNAIQAFYADYQPIYYKRHYDNFQKRSFRKYYSNPHNKIITGGVELTPNLMNDYYQDPVQEVFDMVYAGFHGPASAIPIGYSTSNYVGFSNHFTPVPQMKPSPMEMILERKEDIVNNINDYIWYAQKHTRKSF